MSESGDTTPPAATASTAGALLRAARQAQGLHVAALATTLKVPPRKLEALENDRYDEFQGATFVRALAQAACRALKIDPTPVLERLPELDGGALSQLERGLNAPFRERGVRRDSAEMSAASRAVVVLVAVLALGTLAFVFWPTNWQLPSLTTASSPASTTTDTPVNISAPLSLPGAPASAVTEPNFPAPALPPAGLPTTQLPSQAGVLPGAPAVSPQPAPAPGMRSAVSAPVSASPAPAPAASVAVAVPGGTLLQLRANKASWVEVVDGRSQVLLARTLAPGEAVGFDGVLPLRVKIGNVSGTDVSFRGRAVDLAPQTRDNVARLELK